MQDKRRRLFDSSFHNIHFIQDNARLNELAFNFLLHLPYSPDITPSDFYIFALLKSCQSGRNFNNSIEIQETMDEWLQGKPKKFYQKAFQELPNRWQNVIDSEGNYFE